MCKVTFDGRSGIGKTLLARKLSGGYDEIRHTPTIGVEVRFFSYRNRVINIWDCSGDVKFNGLRTGYLLGGEFFFIFVDNNTTKESFNNRIVETLSINDNPCIIVVSMDGTSPEGIEVDKIISLQNNSREELMDTLFGNLI